MEVDKDFRTETCMLSGGYIDGGHWYAVECEVKVSNFWDARVCRASADNLIKEDGVRTGGGKTRYRVLSWSDVMPRMR